MKKHQWFWFVATVMGFFTFVYQVRSDDCVNPPGGLIGFWQAESNTVNQAGLSTNTLVGNTTYGPGKIGQAFYFDGLGDAVNLGNPPAYQLQDFTIEAWIRRTSTNKASMNAGGGEVFSYGNNGYAFGLQDNGVFFLSNVGVDAATADISLTDTNAFHHVAVSKNGSTVVFYLDGVASSAVTYETTFFFNSTVAIGARGDNLGSFIGAIDEIAIYDHGLADSEIQSIYNAGTNGKCVPCSLFTQPQSISVGTNNTAFFSVQAGGNPAPTFQWQLNGTPLTDATNASLIIPNPSAADVGSYSVVINCPAGASTSSDATLTLDNSTCTPPTSGLVSWWPAEGNFNDATGKSPGSQVGTVTYVSGEGGQAFSFPLSGGSVNLGNQPSLRLQNFTIEAWVKRDSTTQSSASSDGGIFFGFGTAGYALGMQNSGTLYLSKVGFDSLSTALTITNTNTFHHIALTKNNTNIVFYVDGVASSNLFYGSTFTFNTSAAIGARGDTGANSFLGAVDEMTIYNRALTSTEILSIYNAGGSAKCYLPPIITAQPQNGGAALGGNYTNNVIVASLLPTQFQWNFNANPINGATNSSLILTNVQFSQAGTYFVVVSNLLGAVTSSNVNLQVLILPAITNQPQSLSAIAGGSASFSVGASGSTPLTYQWQKSGNNILAATNSIFTISNIVAANADTYRVVVSNAAGSVTSSNAVLSLNPTILVNNLAGDPFSFTNVASVPIKITSAYSNATILYTLDGSTPDFDSTFYSGSFAITQSCVIRAVAFDASFNSVQSAPVTVSLWHTYALTVVNPGGGSVALNPVGGIYRNDQTVQATATASNGWTFIQWTGEVSSTNSVVNVSMEKAKSIYAVFGAPVSVTTPANGVIRLNPALPFYPYGSLVQACGIPNAGYSFSIWGGSQSNPTNPLPFIMNATNLSVTALFSGLTGGKFALTVVPNGSGTVAVTTRANNYTSGTAVSIAATPLSSNVFYYWSGDATGTNNPLAVTMNASKVITVNFSGGNFPIQLGVARTNNSVRLSLAGEPTKVFDVQGSTNLNAWGTISTLTNTNGTVIFNDSLTSSNKFYRAKLH